MRGYDDLPTGDDVIDGIDMRLKFAVAIQVLDRIRAKGIDPSTIDPRTVKVRPSKDGSGVDIEYRIERNRKGS